MRCSSHEALLVCSVSPGKLNGTADVAIKTLKKGSMSPADFLREAEIMHKMRHKKLVTLLAVCSKNEPIWIITELMANGSLLDYLRKDGTPQIVKFPMLVKMAAQVRRVVFRSGQTETCPSALNGFRFFFFLNEETSFDSDDK